MSIFKNFPEHVWVLAKANENGMYMIHAKVHPNGKCKTYPEEMTFQEALDRTLEMQEILGLPDEAVMIHINKAVVDQPSILNRKMKNYLNSKGHSFDKTKSPTSRQEE